MDKAQSLSIWKELGCDVEDAEDAPSRTSEANMLFQAMGTLEGSWGVCTITLAYPKPLFPGAKHADIHNMAIPSIADLNLRAAIAPCCQD